MAELLVVYSVPYVREGKAPISHIRITGERSYICDPKMEHAPPPRVLASEMGTPLSKVCGQCGRLLNRIVEEELEP